MMKEITIQEGDRGNILMLHANAYTPLCYKQMMSSISGYQFYLPYQRPLWPDSNPKKLKTWHHLVDDLIEHMDHKNHRDMIGMGHSLGGIVCWLAAIKRPELFSRLILIDPVILPRQYTRWLSLVPYWLKRKFLPIIKIAEKRTDQWHSAEEAKSYFLSKKIFQRFDERVLEDFIAHGLTQEDSFLRLTYPKAWEARIYATAPAIWDKMEETACPVDIIRGQYSDVLIDPTWSALKDRIGAQYCHQIDEAGHLIPFERPQHCGDIITSLLDQPIQK